MSELSIHKTIKEKQKVYDYKLIKNMHELMDVLNPQCSNTIYRGQVDGSWKIFSSMQRDVSFPIIRTVHN